MTPRAAHPALSRRTFAALGMSAAAMPVLAACGAGGTSSSGDGPAAVVLTAAFPPDAENYDPHQRPQTVARTISRQIADVLLDQDPVTGELHPWLATSWDINDDTTEFTFTLREDVTFSDGTAFTAQSVKNNFDRIRDLGSLAYIGANLLRGYVETVVESEFVARVVFDAPNAQFLQGTSTQSLSILADATLQLEPEEVARGNVIGSGPFTLENYTPGESITLVRREAYAWGSPLYNNEGAAHVSEVRIQFIPDGTTRAGAVSSGQVDFGFLLDAATLPSLSGNVSLEQLAYKGIAIPLVPFVYRPIFTHPEVRQAINFATNREEIAERIFQGHVVPATSVLTAATPGYADQSELLTYDVERAVSILEQAGWQVGADGVRTNAQGERLSIEIKYAGSGTPNEQMFQLLQTQWREVGIEFVLSPTTEAEMSEYTLYDAPYDLTTWSQGRADPDVLRVVYSSFYENQSFFFGNPVAQIDEALTRLQTTTDPAEREQAAAEAQRLILEGGYSFPLYDANANLASGPRITRTRFDAERKPAFVDFEVEG